MGDEYVKDPKKATERGKVAEVGPRGGMRYRSVGSPSVKPNPKSRSQRSVSRIYLGEIGDVGFFEENGRYIAYSRPDDEQGKKTIERVQKLMSEGRTLIDIILEVADKD